MLMKKRIYLKVLSVLLLCITMIISFFNTASSLSWDGSSSGGGGNGTSAGPNGYAIATTDEENCIGYRFSIVTSSGTTKNNRSIDVFRKNNSYATYEYNNGYRFTTKYNKKQLIGLQNSSFSTSHTMAYCYLESNLNFYSSLPNPSGMGTWQNTGTNINAVLNELGAVGTLGLSYGDKVLVEPIYSVRLEGVWHSLTATEIALYGKHILGASSDGGYSYTSESWGFISEYVNMHYPNALFTPDGQGLWNSAKTLTKRSSFYTIINYGYGVGIAYTEKKADYSPSLAVKKVMIYKGNVGTKTYLYGENSGNTFSSYVYSKGYPECGDQIFFSVYFPKETQNVYVRQRIWIDGVLKGDRKGYSNSLEYFDIKLPSGTIPQNEYRYFITAQVDWIDTAGNTLKTGVATQFYIPVMPTLVRYSVKMNNIEGLTQATSGMDGKSGSVYIGQRVQPSYTFKSKNTWNANVNLSGTAYEYRNGTFTKITTAVADVRENNTTISSAANKIYPSTLGYIRVYDEGAGKMHFKLASSWYPDTTHTARSSEYDVDVVKADAEIVEIKLVDSSGTYVSTSNLIAGTVLTPRYVYRNNTSCRIYVEGYDNDGSVIGESIYGIDPGEIIEVEGKSFTVPTGNNMEIWGGVFLEGAGIHNTEWESDGDNNELTLKCTITYPLVLLPIVPSSPYRENTSVITSYWVVNTTTTDYIPDDNIRAKINVYDNENLICEKYVDSVIVPKGDINLIYFKWDVPEGLSGEKIHIKAALMKESAAFYYCEKDYSTIAYNIYETPDTTYEKKAPEGFSVPSVPLNTSGSNMWWEYKYIDGEFVKKYYSLSFASQTVDIAPSTGETAYQKRNKWYMKSGYGISISASLTYTNNTGSEMALSNMYTECQYAVCEYPETGYVIGENLSSTLENTGDKFEYRIFKTYSRTHFTPIYFPNVNYTVKVLFSDIWTPVGMISSYRSSNSIMISGSNYDDWNIGRK